MIEQLMEEAVSPESWHAAWKAVVANDGAPGIDGMRCKELVEHLRQHGEAIRAKLLAGQYAPSPVKRVTHSQARRRRTPRAAPAWLFSPPGHRSL